MVTSPKILILKDLLKSHLDFCAKLQMQKKLEAELYDGWGTGNLSHKPKLKILNASKTHCEMHACL
jgi:hypothetical protein